MGIFDASIPPDVTKTTTTSTQAPDYYNNYLSGIAATGTAAMNRPGSELVAPLNELQVAGYSATPTAAMSYKPGLTAAEQTANQAAQGITTENINQYMNPYTHNVVDEMARLQNENVQRNLMPALKGSFVGTGGLGSRRYAGATGQTLADLQAGLTGQQTKALETGYSQALDAAIKQSQLQNIAAQTQGSLAKQEQELGLAGTGAVTKAGSELQAYEQAVRDAPLKQASNVAALMRGLEVPKTTVAKTVGPLGNTYGPSTADQIGALLSAYQAASSGKYGSTIQGAANNLGNLISGGLKSLGNLGGTTEAGPDSSAGTGTTGAGFTGDTGSTPGGGFQGATAGEGSDANIENNLANMTQEEINQYLYGNVGGNEYTGAINTDLSGGDLSPLDLMSESFLGY